MVRTPYPDRRFVRLRLPSPQHPDATVTVTASDPATDDFPLVAAVAGGDPARAGLLEARMRALVAREAEIFAWLEQDASRTALFLADPAGALKAALGDLPDDFFEDWSGSGRSTGSELDG